MFNIKWPVTAYNNKICCESKEITLPKKKKKISYLPRGDTILFIFIFIYIYIYIYFFFFFCGSIFLHLAPVYRWWIGCWLRWWGVEWAELILESFVYYLFASILFNVSTTSFMAGRFLGSDSRHFRVSCTASNAASVEYWPSIRISIMLFNFLLLERDGLSHSTRFCCPLRLFASTARLPVSISSRTTPKP